MNIHSERTSIDIINCAKTFADGTRALKPSNLRIEPGEVVALLGPSGCGKTTLLRLIAGLETPDRESQILFSSVDVTRVQAEQRGIGMVFQSYALFPHMTVEANISYGLRLQGAAADVQKKTVGELIDLVRLNGLEKKRPAELSGGQRQRVALARAVAVRPRVLLLDEPMAALDAKLKESLRDELADLLRTLGITAVHVTHDQQEALTIADRLAVMHAGQIVQVGDGETLYRQPAHPFVARFLGRVNTIKRDNQAMKEGLIRLGSLSIPCPEPLKSQTELLVRPEDIHIQAAPDSDAHAAQVVRRVFLGDHVQLHVHIPGQSEFTIEQNGLAPWKVGDRLTLSIHPDRFLSAEA